jgi:hypothetical protein
LGLLPQSQNRRLVAAVINLLHIITTTIIILRVSPSLNPTDHISICRAD